MTAREAEKRAATHNDGCPPTCPACLSRDLQAKAEAVRETCAQMVDEVAHQENRDGRKANLGFAAVLAGLAKRMRMA